MLPSESAKDLSLTDISYANGGLYRCIATNVAGIAESQDGELHINTPPTITLDPIAVILDPGRSMSCVLLLNVCF